jgi:hypothetical protein
VGSGRALIRRGCVALPQALEDIQASQPEPPGFVSRKGVDAAGAVGIEVVRAMCQPSGHDQPSKTFTKGP